MKVDNNLITRNITETVKYNGDNGMQLMDRNNCAVLALAEAFELAYDVAYNYAQAVWVRIKRKGVVTDNIINTFNSGIKILDKKVTEQKVYTKYRQSNGKYISRKMKISTFIKEHPKGIYYVIVKRHALVIKDGVMYDNAGFTDRFNRPIHYAWKIK
jgi:hypothetical protein